MTGFVDNYTVILDTEKINSDNVNISLLKN